MFRLATARLFPGLSENQRNFQIFVMGLLVTRYALQQLHLQACLKSRKIYKIYNVGLPSALIVKSQLMKWPLTSS